jgi:hypothetical protein
MDPALLVADLLGEVGAPGREGSGQIIGAPGEFEEPIWPEGKIVGMPDDVAEALELAECCESIGGNERGPNSRQFEAEPLEQSFVVIALFLEMILEGLTDPFEGPFEDIVSPPQFVCTGFEVTGNGLFQAQRRLAGGVLDDRGIGPRVPGPEWLVRWHPQFTLGDDLVAESAFGEEQDVDAASQAFRQKADELIDRMPGWFGIEREIDVGMVVELVGLGDRSEQANWDAREQVTQGVAQAGPGFEPQRFGSVAAFAIPLLE